MIREGSFWSNCFFTQIFIHLTPQDLLYLGRSSKTLRALIFNKRSSFLWRAARQQVEGLPPLPPFLSEPRYANLAFDHYCLVSGAIVSWNPGSFLQRIASNPMSRVSFGYSWLAIVMNAKRLCEHEPCLWLMEFRFETCHQDKWRSDRRRVPYHHALTTWQYTWQSVTLYPKCATASFTTNTSNTICSQSWTQISRTGGYSVS